MADPVAHLEVGEVGPPTEPPGAEDQRRHEHEDAERELPAEQQDRDQRPDEQQDVLDEGREPHLHELLQRVDVGRHARHQAAGLLALEEVEPERDQVAEHPDPQVAQERLADPRHDHDGDAAEHQREQRDDDVDQRRLVEDRAVAGLDPLVDAAADQERSGEQARGLDGQHADREHDRAAVGAQHAAQSPHQLGGLVTVEPLLDDGPRPPEAS